MTGSGWNSSNERSAAQLRDDALKAKYGKAYSRYAKVTAGEWETRMDRPPLDGKRKKIKGWRSISREEPRIEACIFRYSRCWPICMPYAVLTIGVLGLNFQEASKKGLRLGDDEGIDTFVLDRNGQPKELTQAWISRLLGLKKWNVHAQLQHMKAKKLLLTEGKRLSMVPDPPALSEEERQKVLQTENFLNLPVDLKELINGFKPPREILELLAKLPEKVLRTEYFSKFSVLQAEYEKQRKVLQTEKEKGWEVLCMEISNLYSSSSSSSQGEECPSSSSPNTSEPATTTTEAPPPAEEETAAGLPAEENPTDLILEAMEAHLGQVDPVLAVRMEKTCREKAKDITAGEICDLTNEVMQQRGKAVKKADSPPVYLVTSVANAVTPAALVRLRERKDPTGGNAKCTCGTFPHVQGCAKFAFAWGATGDD